MLKKFVKLLFGDKQARDMKRLTPLVEEINEVCKEYESLSDEALQAKTGDFRRLLHAAPRVGRVQGLIAVCEEAEAFLSRHPDVRDSVFMPTRRDAHNGELVVFVRLKEGVAPNADTATTIREGMARLAPHYKPRNVVFIDEYPMHEVDKHQRVDFHQLMRAIETIEFDPWEAVAWADLASQLGHEDEPVSLDDLLPEAFAAVKETCRRHVGKKWPAAGAEIEWNMVPFDVQLAGGIALHGGNVAEMGTGEGKTLVAVAPLYLNGLSAKGACLVTVNDYLAKRDSEWMAPIFEFLGLTVGCIDKHQPGTPQRRAAYRCDVIYGTNNEFGFDYLRDNMVMHRSQIVQRHHFFAIIDEVDSILIDEARTPLIISGPVDRSNRAYEEVLPMVRELVNKQQMLVSRLTKEAEEFLEQDPESWDAGVRLVQAHKGMPKHNRYMKLMEDPRFQKLRDKVEARLMMEKQIKEAEEELFFSVEERNRQIDLTDKGRAALRPSDPDYFVLPDLVEEFARIDMMKDADDAKRDELKLQARANHESKAEVLHTISQLLHAFVLKRRDVDYVVEEGKIVIVDENTGRKMNGRRWSDGLHGAVEAKEGVKIEKETQTLATITIQNYFRMYEKLAGMTGTAETESAEFAHTYGMDVIVIPPNKPIARKDLDDVVFKTKREKYKAVLDEIERLHQMGLPILVGTTSVANSETISRMLRTRKISHSVLNAKNHAQEAEIVAKAGLRGAVTIATNMAGRGTDIKLGPGVKEPGKDPQTGEEWPGGLQILGTERHEARRIDRQLRGRSGRQGDPGCSRFFVSLEDDLMRWFGSDRIASMLTRLGLQEGEPIIHPWVTRAIGNAQKKVEGINQERRKRTLEYDDVMNQQRDTIYKLRRELLQEDDLRDTMLEIFAAALENVFKADFGEPKNVESWDLGGFFDWLSRILYMKDLAPLREAHYSSFDDLLEAVMEVVIEAHDEKAALLGPQLTPALCRAVAIRTIDSEWQDHLLAIDGLRDAVGLRGYGQRDPIIEFRKDARAMFDDLLVTVHREVFDRFFRTQVATEQPAQQRVSRMVAQKPEVTGPAEQAAAAAPKPGRAPGAPAGQKYKDCHGAEARAGERDGAPEA